MVFKINCSLKGELYLREREKDQQTNKKKKCSDALNKRLIKQASNFLKIVPDCFLVSVGLGLDT